MVRNRCARYVARDRVNCGSTKLLRSMPLTTVAQIVGGALDQIPQLMHKLSNSSLLGDFGSGYQYQCPTANERRRKVRKGPPLWGAHPGA